MELTENEKGLLVSLLKIHAKEIEEAEDMPHYDLQVFAGEAKYHEFIEELIKKLS